MKQFNENMLDDAERFTGNNLQVKNDIMLLLNECKTESDYQVFEQLCFTGKYVNGLFRILKSAGSNPEVESTDHVKKDLSENMEKVISQLEKITLNSSEDVKKIFKAKYFELTPETLNNLKLLTSDLDVIKKYINYLKRSPEV